MKIPALLTFLLAAVLSALPLSQARADNDVSFDVFYNSLGDQGDWYNTPEYGYVWQPSIAYQNDKWRPYSDGYWAQTDDGWTWVSYENFGWATYHYGRWTRLENTGWVWVPGYEWGPGWVSWRTNDDYVGWAPLPPKPETGGGGGGASLTVDYNTVEPENGYNTEVDQQYDIGPTNYCFVETRYFGAPVLREVLLPPQRNIIIIENTINVTNITYRRGGPRVIVFNGGPDFAFINGRVDRPIQRLRIEPNVNYDFAHGPRDRNPNVVRDGVFQIAAPRIAPRPINFSQVKPPVVKRDIRDARVEHGWSNTGADQTTVQRVRQQFQTQAQEHPTRPPGNPAANLVPPAGPPPHERDARTTPAAPPAATPVVSATPPRGNSDADRRARRDAAQRERDARTNGGFQPTPAATPAVRPSAAPRNPPGQPSNDTRREPNAPEVTHEPTAAPTPAREANPNREPREHNRPTNTPANTPAAPPREERRNQPPAEPRTATPNAATEETRRTPRQQERTQPAATPTRNTEAEPERHPVRTEERPQNPPPAPRQEVREPRPPAQTAPPAPRQEVRETREAKPQPQPAGGNADDKKKRDGQQ